MKARIRRIEIATGYRKAGGRNHGLKWEPRWEVTITVDSEERAQQLRDRMAKEENVISSRCERSAGAWICMRVGMPVCGR